VDVDFALHASSQKKTATLMRGHDAALSAVPYFLNLGLCADFLIADDLVYARGDFASTFEVTIRE
jgi:hypothetical protein